MRLIIALLLACGLQGCIMSSSAEADCATSATAICKFGQLCACFEVYKRDVSGSADVKFLRAATVICFGDVASPAARSECLPFSVGTDGRNGEEVTLVAVEDEQGEEELLLLYGGLSEEDCVELRLTPVYSFPASAYLGCEIAE